MGRLSRRRRRLPALLRVHASLRVISSSSSSSCFLRPSSLEALLLLHLIIISDPPLLLLVPPPLTAFLLHSPRAGSARAAAVAAAVAADTGEVVAARPDVDGQDGAEVGAAYLPENGVDARIEADGDVQAAEAALDVDVAHRACGREARDAEVEAGDLFVAFPRLYCRRRCCCCCQRRRRGVCNARAATHPNGVVAV